MSSKRFLGAYLDAQISERIPDEVFFFTGVIFTVVLPQTIYCAYGGIVSPMMFAANALVGSLLGWAMHRQSPNPIPSCVRTGTMPQAPPSEDTTKRDAA
ncbi:MAG TPA: hypothetical protein VF666_03370 [Pyrinomonadaceae bacterium]|jgi:hypothetical protein